MGDDPTRSGLSRKHILHAIDDSLRRLGVDYVDLYQIHRFDHDTPIEETLEALNDVVQAGEGTLHRRVARCSRGSSRPCSTSPTGTAGRGS